MPQSCRLMGVTQSGVCAHYSIGCLQVRSAMALASVLNRTLVIPELWCGADRWWAPHGGIIPGSSLHLPFPCPLDHVLDLEQCAPRYSLP